MGRIVFENMAYRKLVCWKMILGNCFQGNPEDGLNLFSVMLGRTKSLRRGCQGQMKAEEEFSRMKLLFIGLRLRLCWIVKRCQRLLQPNDYCIPFKAPVCTLLVHG